MYRVYSKHWLGATPRGGRRDFDDLDDAILDCCGLTKYRRALVAHVVEIAPDGHPITARIVFTSTRRRLTRRPAPGAVTKAGD